MAQINKICHSAHEQTAHKLYEQKSATDQTQFFEAYAFHLK